jgi:hypothetical protein
MALLISSDADIANLAISHLGKSSEIANLTDDNSDEANAVNRFYNIALEEVFRQWPWPFTRKFQVLEVVELNPTSEWAFAYRYPADCFDARRIVSGNRTDNNTSKVRYWVGTDVIGNLIFTNRAEACLEYTFKQSIVTRWPADFKMGFSYLLAFYIAPRLTDGDPFNLQPKVLKLAEQKLEAAAAKAFNEEEPDPQQDSEFMRARGAGPFDLTGRNFPLNPF